MKKGVFRLCAGLLAAVLLSLAVVPCYAESDKYTSTGTFWQAVADKWYFNGTVIPAIIGTVSDKVCSESGDKKHHGSLKSYEQNPDKSYTAICDFCSAEFPVYDADLSAAYDSYVATLQNPVIQSGRSLYCYPSSFGNITRVTSLADVKQEPVSYNDVSRSQFETYPDPYHISGRGYGLGSVRSYFHLYFQVPVSGRYYLSWPKDFYTPPTGYVYKWGSGNLNDRHSTVYYPSDTYVGPTTSSSSIYFDSSVVYGFSFHSCIECQENGWVSYSVFSELIPDDEYFSGLVVSSGDINTRPTSITGGNYGIVGDNGQITKVEDNSTIVNETNNTYYNPATGTTVPITGWSYDYSDRSYKVTLESGDTATITYGDEYITIKEGDTIYNVYYLIDGSGNPSCEHDWQESSSTDPTCTLPGKVTLSCTKCQQTKTESVPALGHDWQVKQTVTTQYDEEGNLTQQGYTIFECSRCHEQYKSPDGTAPPGGGSGTDPGGEEGETTIGGLIEKLLSGVGSIVGGIIKGLLSLLTKAVEALAGLAELFTTFVGSLVELWGGFTSFLSAVFPFLPEEFVIIIELGLILMIAAAVFRKFIS